LTSVSIIELYAHSEVLLACLRLAISNQYFVKVFTTSAVQAELEGVKEWDNLSADNKFVKPQEVSLPAFLKQHSTVFSNQDVLIITTATSHYNYWADLVKKANYTALIIHNFNTYYYDNKIKEPTKINLNLIKNWGRWFKAYIFQEEKNRANLFLYIKVFLALEGLNVDNIRRLQSSNYSSKPILELPTLFSLNTSVSDTKKSEVTVIIPGSITDNGKDFLQIYHVLKRIIPKIEIRLTLILLGSPRGKEGVAIQSKYKELESSIVQVIVFEQSIKRIDYENHLQKCDFIILPIQASYRFGRHIEQYGITSISGTVNDALLFGKPALIPQHYYLSPELTSTLFEKYINANDLEVKLLDWLNNMSYRQHQQLFRDKELLSFSIEQKANQFKEIISQIKG